jgi:hypothetical protein
MPGSNSQAMAAGKVFRFRTTVWIGYSTSDRFQEKDTPEDLCHVHG